MRSDMATCCLWCAGQTEELRDRLAKAEHERDASRVEAEELRGALRTLIEALGDVCLGAVAPIEVARAILARPPTVAALRAREALAALGAAKELLAAYTNAGACPGDAVLMKYRFARAAREAAERETKP